MKYKYKKVLIYDTGSFVSLALRLSEDFGQVFYFCNWKQDFSRTQDLNIGAGFSEFTWVRNFWDCINEEKPDLIVFTDILGSDLQEQLIRMGFNVWGAREADCLEIYKWDFIKYQNNIGMPVPNSIHVTGIDNLRKELYSIYNKYPSNIVDAKSLSVSYDIKQDDLTEEELADLREDIQEGKMQTVFQEDETGTILDGNKRLEISQEENKKVKVFTLPKGTTPEEATKISDYLNKPRWIKIDADQRGDIETFKYIEPEATELSILLPLERNLGSSAKTLDFIIQDNVDAEVETGFDGWVIDGEFSKQSFFGIEVKSKAYIGTAREYSKLPESVRYCNDKLQPALKAYGMRGSYHTEIREGNDGKYYLIDMTMRFGNPPTNIMMELIDNFAEILYEGAKGNIVEPIFRAKYGCEVVIKSPLAMDNDFKLIVPEEIQKWVKQPYIYKNSETGSIIVMKKLVPNDFVGSVVAIADTAEQALELCKQRLELIDGYMLSYDHECLEEAMNQLQEL